MFFPIIIIGVIVLIAMAANQQHKRVVASWGEAARRLGLQLEAGSRFSNPLITGNLNGIPVRVDSYTRRHNNNSTTYTRYQVRYPSTGFDFELKREGGLTKIVRFFGVKDVEMGDAAFDDAFKITTDDPSRLQQLLTPSVRSGLFRLMASFPSVVISEDHIGMTPTGLEKNPDRLESVVRRLVGTAQLLASPSGGVSDQVVVDRQQGMVAELADRLRQAVEAHPEDVDQRIFEVETLAAAGDDEQAGRRLGELERMAPADPDVVGWRKTLETPDEPSVGRDVGVEEIAEDLFGGSDLSFETRTKFNSKYAGAAVNWEGTVKEVRDSGAGAKATITVATVANDLYGNTDVDVVVETTGSAPTRGTKVTVSGMLDRIDPLMRNLYLANASIS
jgi:hypothetical protein